MSRAPASRLRRRLAAARRADGERGMVMVVTAIFLVVILGTAALVIDLAQLREDRAYNRKSADLVATAAATTLASPTGTMASACTDAWNYFLDNATDHGTVTGAPPCSTAFSADCDPTASRTATGTTGRYTVTFTNPVLDANRLMAHPDVVGGATQAINADQDGTPSERIGVEIVRARTNSFGAVVGVGTTSTDSHSVARTMTRFDIGGPIALLILNKTDCNVLTASGQAKIIINPSGSKPGYITVDSNATGNLCSQNNTWALDALGTQNSAIQALANPTTGAAGVIRMYALALGQGNSKAYDPSAAVSPRPPASISQASSSSKVCTCCSSTRRIACPSRNSTTQPSSRWTSSMFS